MTNLSDLEEIEKAYSLIVECLNVNGINLYHGLNALCNVIEHTIEESLSYEDCISFLDSLKESYAVLLKKKKEMS